MKCPVCTSTNLLISERQGIEIDYCPQCRGVWLDRGELDKLIERAPAAAAPAPAMHQQRAAPPAPQAYDPRYGHGGHSGHHHRDSHGYDYKRKKKGGFLGEIFDFD
ncbi:zf-TFIIB domain-containing protein [Herbaspirillum robiniae]|uniref:Transcription factor zinc-finger domain-containing protein n=1 Tax=Herbaspirillum robiniae TaxID=2014887 RepID=A0A246WN15_9BURK|nr:zf-TFIIB domain-containing protein [Herbaspirillum robiniae]OWY27755.1 hypothetical protein CEJ42_16830 [Herbaspirillum robiniae]